MHAHWGSAVVHMPLWLDLMLFLGVGGCWCWFLSGCWLHGLNPYEGLRLGPTPSQLAIAPTSMHAHALQPVLAL